MTPRRIKAIIGILFIMAVCIVYCWLWKDEPSHNDSDLRLERLDVPDEENGFTYLNLSHDDFHYPDDRKKREVVWEIESGMKWDETLAKEMLEKNRATYELIDRGLGCSEFQIVINDVGKYRSHMWRLRDIASLISLRAYYLFNTGREKEAFDDAMKAIRLGHMTLKAGGSWHDMLGSISAKIRGHSTFRTLLKKTTLTPEILKDYINELGKYTCDKEGYIISFRAQYTLSCMVIDDFEAGKLDPFDYLIGVYSPGGGSSFLSGFRRIGYSFKPNRTRRMLSELFRHFLETRASKDYLKDYDTTPLPWYEECQYPRRFTPNNLGKFLVGGRGFQWLLSENNRFTNQASFIGTQIFVALKCYKMEHGKLPDTLDDLMPEFFKEIPKDPFDAKPVRYSKTKKIIWFVGHDLTDSGGATLDELQMYKDDPRKLLREIKDPTVIIDF